MDEIQRFIINHLNEEHQVHVDPHDSLTLGGLDSVAMAELTFELEKRFSIKIDEEILDIDTIEELAAYVGEKQSNFPSS
jgi:acyl carrier protein